MNAPQPTKISSLHTQAAIDFAECMLVYAGRLDYGMAVDALESTLTDQYSLLIQSSFGISCGIEPRIIREELLTQFNLDRIMSTNSTIIIDPFGKVTIQNVHRQVSCSGCSNCSCSSCSGSSEDEPADSEFTLTPSYDTETIPGTTIIDCWQLAYTGSKTISKYPERIYEEQTATVIKEYSHVGSGKYVLSSGTQTTIVGTDTFPVRIGQVCFSDGCIKSTFELSVTAIEQVNLCVLVTGADFSAVDQLLAPLPPSTDNRLTRITLAGVTGGVYTTEFTLYPTTIVVTDTAATQYTFTHSTGGVYYPDGGGFIEVPAALLGTWSVEVVGAEYSVTRIADGLESTGCNQSLTISMDV